MSKDTADLLKFPFQKNEEKCQWENVICKLRYWSYTKFLTWVLQSKKGMRACWAITGAGSYRHTKRKHTWVLSQNIWGHLLWNIFWIKFKLGIKDFPSPIPRAVVYSFSWGFTLLQFCECTSLRTTSMWNYQCTQPYCDSRFTCDFWSFKSSLALLHEK